MADQPNTSGAQFRADRPAEQEAVRTTIVGGRPPGSGQPVGAVPRGVEVLLRKASVDAEFKELLLRERAAAAQTIGLRLELSEAAMLSAAPAAQLEAIIARTTVPQEHRRAFLGQAAAAMLAAIGAVTTGCEASKGSRPDIPSAGSRPDEPSRHAPSDKFKTGGIRPDLPTEGSRPDKVSPREPQRTPEPPDRPPVTKGIRPDRPPGTADEARPL